MRTDEYGYTWIDWQTILLIKINEHNADVFIPIPLFGTLWLYWSALTPYGEER